MSTCSVGGGDQTKEGKKWNRNSRENGVRIKIDHRRRRIINLVTKKKKRESVQYEREGWRGIGVRGDA